MSRGYKDPKSNKNYVIIPKAPPREVLKMFSGEGGMTIEEFRGLCACGFDVEILEPPIITYKQVVVAECNNLLAVEKSKKGKCIIHKESVESMSALATDIAMKKRDGLNIFAGIGARRLTDFFVNGAKSNEPIKRKSSPSSNTSTPPNKKKKI
jgi:hypothetical protein